MAKQRKNLHISSSAPPPQNAPLKIQFLIPHLSWHQLTNFFMLGFYFGPLLNFYICPPGGATFYNSKHAVKFQSFFSVSLKDALLLKS